MDYPLDLLRSISRASSAFGRGTRYRPWVTAPREARISPPEHAVTSSAVSVPMRDGVTLRGILHRPVGVQSAPGVLFANGYALDEPYLAPTIDQLARRGYMVLKANLRGVPPSDGEPGLYEHYGEDAHDLIEWLAGQSGCSGRIGMMGASLLGLVQYLAAKAAPPSLKAILPDDAGGDSYWHLWYPGGMRPGPGRAARQSFVGAQNEYPLAAEHPDYDAFWRARTIQPEDLEAIARRHIAVLLTTGWDSYMLGSAKAYEWLKVGRRGNRLRLIIGPWAHGAFLSPDPPLQGPGVLPYTGFEFAVLWLDRYLKGIKNHVDDLFPVLLYVQGPDEWRLEEDWPLPLEQRTLLYLREIPSGSGGGLNDGSLTLQPPTDDQPVSYQYSPQGPYNWAAVTMASRPRIDKAPYEAHGLAWTTDMLESSIEVTGYPRFSFWAKLSAPDTDFVVEITDVSVNEAGQLQSLQVTRGYLNAMRYFSRSHPQPLLPGQPYRFEIELYPTSYVFRAGHLIRVTLQGSAIDPLAQPPQESPAPPGTDPEALLRPHGPGLNPLACDVTVLQDEAHPSFIDLPVIGATLID